NNVPAAQSTDENVTIIFNAGNENLISVSDPDAGSNVIQIQLAATNGLISLSTITGLIFTVGDGANDTAMTFTGTLANINAALNGLTFAPTPSYNGPASLQIISNDLGQIGGGDLTDTDTINITINAVDEAPTMTGGNTIT